MALILISHDLGVVARATRHLLVLYAGTRFEEGATPEVLLRPRNPYTRGLLGAVPRRRRSAGGKVRHHSGHRSDLRSPAAGLPLRDTLRRSHCRPATPVSRAGASPRTAGASAASGPQEGRFDAGPLAGGRGSDAPLRRRRPVRRRPRISKKGARRRLAQHGGGRDPRHRGRVGLREVDAGAARDGARPADGGRVLLDGEPLFALGPRALARRRRDLQMVFQDPYGSLDPRQTVGRIVAEPLHLLVPRLGRAERASAGRRDARGGRARTGGRQPLSASIFGWAAAADRHRTRPRSRRRSSSWPTSPCRPSTFRSRRRFST